MSKKSVVLKIVCLPKLMLVVALIGLSAFVGCNEKDVDYKVVKIIISAPIPAQVPLEGGISEFTIESDRDWTIVVGDADKKFVSVEPSSGSGKAKITATFLPNTSTERVVSLTVKTQISHEYVKITQEGVPPVVPEGSGKAIVIKRLSQLTF